MRQGRKCIGNIFLLLAVLLYFSASSFAQAVPAYGEAVAVDEAALLSALQQPARGAQQVARFPLLGRKTGEFILKRASSMHPELQARYPQILAFAGVQKGNPSTRIRAEYSPNNGWTSAITDAHGHQQILTTTGSSAATRRYTIYDQADIHLQDFECHNEDDQLLPSQPHQQRSVAGDCQLRRYRLAITCTGEYANAVAGPNPTVPAVIAAMNVAVNRINQVYERDLGITLELIPNNDVLVFLNGATDPFTEGNPGALINESQTQIDSRIDNADYDIGHLFSTQGGGLAQLNSPCANGNKARAVTGVANPTNDGFYIDYVAHEMGHQFGATHTFYNSCSGNISPSTAIEPGSGSTIMAYAGICSPNVQSNSDAYFHTISIQQIATFITSPFGDCAEIIPTTNNAPTVAAAGSFVIPIFTAFELTANASDPDGDSLTYTWEQIDNESGGAQPPQSTNVNGPLFRSLAPSADPRRRFPSGLYPDYEVLPSVPRDMTFQVTVRDNNSSVGCTAEAVANVETAGTTPFRITNYNTTATLEGFSSYTLTWDVAGTTAPPFNTPTVDIYMSLDGGLTYDFTLASAVANSGQASVTIPNVASTNARFVVKAVGNVFLDVNDADLTITEFLGPTFTLNSQSLTAISCSNQPVSYTVDVAAILGFSESVTLIATGLPSGVVPSFSLNNQSGNFTTTLTLANLQGVAQGSYSFLVEASSATEQRTLTLVLVRDSPPTATPAPMTPVDGADIGVVFTNFNWSYNAANGAVQFQLSSDPTFATIDFEQLFTDGTVVATGIAPGIWYWRVAYENGCGLGAYSPINSFRRIPLQRVDLENTSPVAIGSGNGGNYTSTITATQSGDIYQIEVAPLISHTYVGDLSGGIGLPMGPTLQLFNRPDNGRCFGSDLDVVFADDAAQSSDDFENSCSSNMPSISGEFRPVDIFSQTLPREGAGTYTLSITDHAPVDGGNIEEWALSLWYANITDYNESVALNALSVAMGGQRVVASGNISAGAAGVAPSDMRWVVKRLPTAGSLELRGDELMLGESFTQQDVVNGELLYLHDAGTGLSTDQIVFDLLIDDQGYRPNLVLPVSIIANTLSAIATIDEVLDCAGDMDASIIVTASDGTPPYMYSLNGGSFQNSNQFTGLAAGDYTVTVRDALSFEVDAATVTVLDPPVLTLTASATGSTITATGQGGTGVLVYSLNSGPNQASGTFENLQNGTYQVRVTDTNGCTKSKQVVVSVGALLVDLSVTTPILCNGQLGTITVDAAGGTSPYTYSLNGVASQASPVFAGLTAGTYIATVVDATGMSATSAGSVVFIEPAELVAIATITNDQVHITASGGTLPYSYRLDSGPYQSSATFTGLSNGTYTYTVRDANQCTITGSFQISFNNMSIAASSTNISCNGRADGVIEVVASGGTGPYTYSLDGGAAQASGTFDGLAPGQYTVTATDAHGLTATTGTITLTEPPLLQLAATVNGNFINLTASGGTSPYTYSGPGAVSGAGNVFGPLTAGTYTYTVVDELGCEATATAVVTASNLSIAINFNVGQESCPGAGDGAVTLSGVNGTPPYEFSLDGGAFSSTSFYDDLAAGSYTATVRDANGTTASTSFEILARLVPTVDVTVEGSRVSLSNFSDPAANLSYSFNDGGSFSSSAVGYIYTAGTSTVVIRYNGCILEVPVNITAPLAITSDTATACPGEAFATGTVCVTGGVGSFSVVAGLGTVTTTTQPGCDDAYIISIPSNFSSTIVEVVDQTGATRAVPVMVEIHPTFTIDGVIDGNTLTVSVQGGQAPFTYSLDGGASMQSDSVFSNLGDGPIVVTVTDVNGCSSEETFIVSSLSELAQQLELEVFPNPADEYLVVRVASINGLEDYLLVDGVGRVVLRQQAAGPITRLELGALQAGYYTLLVRHAEGAAHVPVIVR